MLYFQYEQQIKYVVISPGTIGPQTGSKISRNIQQLYCYGSKSLNYTYVMQNFNDGNILYIFIKTCYKRPSFRSYNKTNIVRVKLVKMLPSLNFYVKIFAQIEIFKYICKYITGNLTQKCTYMYIQVK